MYIKSIVYFFFLLSFSLFAQDVTLSGNVKDVNSIPITYANIILLKEKDSTLINGTTTNDNGFFKLENLIPNNYIIKISYLGFKDYFKSISLTESTELSSIILNEDTEELDGVLVIAKRPTIKRLVDRLVFNVENSTLSNNNVLDVLKHAPKVMIFNEQINVNGGEPTIYINDRKVHLSSSEVYQLLQATSATNIKSIEVITSPPAKYEAEGGAVINIVTSKNIISGYNGSVYGDFKQGFEFPKYSIGTSHFFKTQKLNAYINYNVSPRKDFKDLGREVLNYSGNNSQIESRWLTNSTEIEKSSNQNINSNIEYDLDKYNSLGFSTSLLIYPREYTKTGIKAITEVFNSNKMLDSTFNTLNNSVKETFNLAFTLDYIHKFKKDGEKLLLSLQHTNYDYSIYQNVDTDYFLPNSDMAFRDNKFQTFSSQGIEIFTGQLDYILPINDSSQFEAGFKVSNINSESILRQFIFENGVRIEDLQNSDTFLYDETNYAGYISYSKDWQNWSFKSGLRTEYTDIVGNSIATNSINNKSYLKFFPSFYLLHKFNEKHELYFNYSKRINRPRYSALNPFKFYYSDNSYVSGNPNLKPEIDDQFVLGYNFNKAYNFELFYSYEYNPTLQLAFQDNDDNILKYLYTNIDKSIIYGGIFTANINIVTNWNLNAYLSLFYNDNQFYTFESNSLLQKNGKWTFLPQINNNILFLKDKSLSADITYYFVSPYAEGSSIVSTRSFLDIGLRKTLWNNRASISMGVTDLFNNLNFTKTSSYTNQDVIFNSKKENRLFVFGFNYKFGNFRLRSNKKEIDLEERNRLNNEED